MALVQRIIKFESSGSVTFDDVMVLVNEVAKLETYLRGLQNSERVISS